MNDFQKDAEELAIGCVGTVAGALQSIRCDENPDWKILERCFYDQALAALEKSYEKGWNEAVEEAAVIAESSDMVGKSGMDIAPHIGAMKRGEK